MKKIYEFLRKVDRLKEIPRSGWLLCGMPSYAVENVCEHSFDVAVLSLLFIDAAKDLSERKILKAALFHDLAESVITDVPSPVKNFFGHKNFDRIEREVLQNIVEKLPDEKIKIIEDIFELNQKEKQFLRDVDLLSILIRCSEYYKKFRCEELKKMFLKVSEELKNSNFEEIKMFSKYIQSITI